MSVVVPAHARELAARLSVLFCSDCELAERLNDAQRLLLGASDRWYSGVHPDAPWVIRSAFCQYQFIMRGAAPAGGRRRRAVGSADGGAVRHRVERGGGARGERS